MYNLENPFSQQQVVAKCVSSVVYNSHISRREKSMCHSPLNRKIFVDGGGGGEGGMGKENKSFGCSKLILI